MLSAVEENNLEVKSRCVLEKSCMMEITSMINTSSLRYRPDVNAAINFVYGSKAMLHLCLYVDTTLAAVIG